MKKALLAIALISASVAASAQGWRDNDRVYRPWDNGPRVEDVVYRSIERDERGRRVIVTTTYTCEQSSWQRDRRTGRRTVVCNEWDKSETREIVRRAPRSNSYDLNGDGRTDGWERLLFQGFREVLEDNN